MTGTELDGYGYKRNIKLYRRHKLQDLINFIFIHLGKQSTTLSGLLMLLLYFRGRMLRYLSHRAPRDIIKNAGIYVITIEPREHYDSVSHAKTMSYRKRTQGMVSIRHAHNPPKRIRHWSLHLLPNVAGACMIAFQKSNGTFSTSTLAPCFCAQK